MSSRFSYTRIDSFSENNTEHSFYWQMITSAVVCTEYFDDFFYEYNEPEIIMI